MSRFRAPKARTSALKVLANGRLFTDAEGSGIVAVRFVPPGAYELYEPTISWTQYPMVSMIKPKTAVSIPFQVRANECTYVGRFLMHTVKPEFVWLDRKEVDLKIVEQGIPKGVRFSSEAPKPRRVPRGSNTGGVLH